MKVTRRSPLTGLDNTIEVPGLTQAMLDECALPREQRRHMQDIMPGIPPELREFVVNGYTPQDWEEMFPQEEGQ